MPSLEIFFDGLCGFVPKSDSSPAEMTVLLVNATAPQGGIPKHTPFLVVPKPEAHEGVEDRMTSYGSSWAIELQSEHLELSYFDTHGTEHAESRNDELEIVRGQQPLEPFPNPSKPAEIKDFRWVPTVENFLGNGKAEPELLRCPSKDAARLRDLIARIRLTSGKVETYAFAEERDHKVYAYQFIDPWGRSRGPTQALAEVVRATIELPCDMVKIKVSLYDFQHRQLKGFVVLPVADLQQIRLQNRPEHPGRDQKGPRQTHHLKRLYNLCDSKPLEQNRLLPTLADLKPRLLGGPRLPELLYLRHRTAKNNTILLEYFSPSNDHLCPFVQFTAAAPPEGDNS